MEIETESEIGHAKEVLDVNYNGEKLNMNFNIGFSWTSQVTLMGKISS